MIAQAKEDHPRTSERTLCRLFSVSRSWYYERPRAEQRAHAKNVALRDAIERIVLEFPGYGYRAGSPRHSGGRVGRSTTSGFCASWAKNRFCAS